MLARPAAPAGRVRGGVREIAPAQGGRGDHRPGFDEAGRADPAPGRCDDADSRHEPIGAGSIGRWPPRRPPRPPADGPRRCRPSHGSGRARPGTPRLRRSRLQASRDATAVEPRDPEPGAAAPGLASTGPGGHTGRDVGHAGTEVEGGTAGCPGAQAPSSSRKVPADVRGQHHAPASPQAPGSDRDPLLENQWPRTRSGSPPRCEEAVSAAAVPDDVAAPDGEPAVPAELTIPEPGRPPPTSRPRSRAGPRPPPRSRTCRRSRDPDRGRPEPPDHGAPCRIPPTSPTERGVPMAATGETAAEPVPSGPAAPSPAGPATPLPDRSPADTTRASIPPPWTPDHPRGSAGGLRARRQPRTRAGTGGSADSGRRRCRPSPRRSRVRHRCRRSAPQTPAAPDAHRRTGPQAGRSAHPRRAARRSRRRPTRRARRTGRRDPARCRRRRCPPASSSRSWRASTRTCGAGSTSTASST